MGTGMVTDFYELTMAASYLRRAMTAPATFSLFVRRLPPDRGYLVAAGLEDCLSALEGLSFDEADGRWLVDAGFAVEDVDRLVGLRFTGDVVAVPEGRVVLPDEPLLEVTAPIAEAQLVETVLVNLVTYQTAIATKAARCRLAAGDMALVDFAARRTHGVEASMAVARLSAIAGFTATSNVAAAQRHGLHAVGTMAHSYVQAFPREADAFRAFAEDFPDRCTLLVDTYDTMRGVDAAIDVIRALPPGAPAAIRIDSGDLGALAAAARRRLDAAALGHVRIMVSGGLDEHDLAALRAQGAPVDMAGVGTRMGVSADAPSLDSAYKLVAYDGRPVHKRSPGKVTLAGPKQVWRRDLAAEGDLLATRDEPGPPGAEPLLVPVMRGGARTAPPGTVAAARQRLQDDLARLPPAALALREPGIPRVRRSARLQALQQEVAGRPQAPLAGAGRAGGRRAPG